MKNILFLIMLVFCVDIADLTAQKLKVETTQLVVVNGDTTNVVKTDTTIVKPCHCDKKIKRKVKKSGEPRTNFGKVLFDVFDFVKKIIPFLH